MHCYTRSWRLEGKLRLPPPESTIPHSYHTIIPLNSQIPTTSITTQQNFLPCPQSLPTIPPLRHRHTKSIDVFRFLEVIEIKRKVMKV
ncbi:hypothetical protein E2C01_038078 [Portunus trituberculatus]|uniref:Uncharacterized protein n=1 Tax=Portunus trituberculatus TaxID=210409 RepID=A0A5B7FFU3_PORTR|nr:hypothetical protein [Portunus trituberculatus]